MQDITVGKKLPSTKVSLQALRELEQFLTDAVWRIVEKPDAAIEDSFSIILQESNFTTHLKSVEEYDLQLLPDGLNKVSINLRLASSRNAKIKSIKLGLHFSKSRDDTEVRISIHGANARVISNAFLEGIVRVVDQRKTYNYLFQPWMLLYGIAFFALLIVFITLDHKETLGRRTTLVAAATAVLCIGWIGFSKTFKPYSQFDSHKDNRRNQIGNWLLSFFLVTVIAGTLITFLQKKYLGL